MSYQDILSKRFHEVINQFNVCPFVGNTCYAPTGESYITLVAGGVKAEGADLPSPYKDDPKEVIKDYVESLKEYLWKDDMNYVRYGSEGTIYIRRYPELVHMFYGECREFGGWPKKYQVYSRLLISDKELDLNLIKGYRF